MECLIQWTACVWIFLMVQVSCQKNKVFYHSKPPENIRPEERIFNWQVYQNEIEPQTALLCPKGLYMSKLMYKMFTTNDKNGPTEDKNMNIHEHGEHVHTVHISNHIEAIFKERLSGLIEKNLESGGMKELVGDEVCSLGNLLNDETFRCRNMSKVQNEGFDCDTYKTIVLDFFQRECATKGSDMTQTVYHKLKAYYLSKTSNDTAEKEDGINFKTSETITTTQVWPGRNHPLGPCPTLLYCLGHQACLFHFSNKFCQNDPFPGKRKHMKVRFTCHDDSHNDNIQAEIRLFLSEKLGLSMGEKDTSSLEQYHLSVLTKSLPTLSSATVFLKYQTVLSKWVPPEKQIISEEEVFETGCPPVETALESGYSGICNPVPVNKEHDSELLWMILARTKTLECRQEITQMFCAFRYSPRGQCFPPFVQNNSTVQSEKQSEFIDWSFKAFPENGQRFSGKEYQEIFQNPLMNLIPSRIAFNILAHNTPEIVLELVSQLFRPEHFFVIVMDQASEASRQRLVELISDIYPGTDNIRVLPAQRSFASSWGSFNIVRAELEGYEELLRMGVWDFTINVSGTCLALRSVDDLAISLAPHRGLSFVRTFDMGNSLDLRHFDKILQTWHSCDKHVYNTLLRRGPPAADLGIYSQNNFQILSREFTELLVSRKTQPRKLQWMHFYQMSTFVPDEMYFRTMLMNSPIWEKNLEVRFYHMKRFHGDNDEFLCRHSEEVDACGQGPGTYVKEDTDELLRESKQFFLARKFSTDTEDETRKAFLKYQREDGYHQKYIKSFPPVLEKALLREAVRRLEESGQLSEAVQQVEVSRLQVVPLLKTADPCCQAIVRHFIQFSQQFRLFLHFTVTFRNGTSTSAVAAIALNPDYLSQCYPSGHIRAIQAGTQTMFDRGRQSKELLPMQPYSVVQSADTGSIHLRFLLERGSQGLAENHCKRTESARNPRHLVYAEWDLPGSMNDRNNAKSKVFRKNRQTKGHMIPFKIELFDPNGNVNLTEVRKVPRQSFGEIQKDRKEVLNLTDVSATVRTGALGPGEWMIQITEVDQENAFVYKQRLVVLDQNFTQITYKDNRCGLYCVKEVALQRNLQSEMYYVKIPLHTSNTQTSESSSQSILREEPEVRSTWGVTYENTQLVLDLVITIVAASLIVRR